MADTTDPCANCDRTFDWDGEYAECENCEKAFCEFCDGKVVWGDKCIFCTEDLEQRCFTTEDQIDFLLDLCGLTEEKLQEKMCEAWICVD